MSSKMSSRLAMASFQLMTGGSRRRRRSFASTLLAIALARLTAALVGSPRWVVMPCDAPFADTLALASKSRAGLMG
jgi:hypothetical protein